MKRLIPMAVLLLVGCGNTASIPSYDELVKYPVSCNLKNEQFPFLKKIQEVKNFPDDPDSLSPDDRKYNAVLKEHLWWFVYNCEQ